jgi:hypothetical protein
LSPKKKLQDYSRRATYANKGVAIWAEMPVYGGNQTENPVSEGVASVWFAGKTSICDSGDRNNLE